jgi:hypothetical protein
MSVIDDQQDGCLRGQRPQGFEQRRRPHAHTRGFRGDRFPHPPAQVVDEPERQVGLPGRAGGAQHPYPPTDRATRDGPQESRLPNAGFSDDEDPPSPGRLDIRDQAIQPRELGDPAHDHTR